MIIPIRCFNCGFVLADKWRWFQERVVALRKEMGLPPQPVTIDGTTKPDTPERKACDELGITR